MRTNYVLIDFENVRPESLDGLDSKHFKVLVFVGASQTTLKFEVAEAMQRLGARAQYVKISGNGPNALDFHIAFYIGHISASDATARFHIISRDTGFDPLVQHLKTKNISVVRSSDIKDIPLLQVANSKSLPEKVAAAVTDLKQRGATKPKTVKTPSKSLRDKVAAVVTNLKQRGSSKPRTVTTLSSTVSSLFGKQLTDAELTELVHELKRLGYIRVHEKKVSYSLPEGDA